MPVSPVVPDYARFLRPTQPCPECPLFVFLPGMDGTGQLLRTQVASLETTFDIRCLSIPPNDLTSWEGLTEQVETLILTEQKANQARSVVLCGESFGGCLALKLAVRAPELFSQVVLVNPASSFNQQALFRWGTPLSGWIPEPLYRLSTLGLLPFLASLGRVNAENRQDLLKAMQSVTQQSSAWRLALLQQFHIPESDLQRITQPVLVIAGADDRLLPSVREAERLVYALPNARMHVLPDSGHACLLEEDVNLHDIMQQYGCLDSKIQADQRSPQAISF